MLANGIKFFARFLDEDLEDLRIDIFQRGFGGRGDRYFRARCRLACGRRLRGARACLVLGGCQIGDLRLDLLELGRHIQHLGQGQDVVIGIDLQIVIQGVGRSQAKAYRRGLRHAQRMAMIGTAVDHRFHVEFDTADQVGDQLALILIGHLCFATAKAANVVAQVFQQAGSLRLLHDGQRTGDIMQAVGNLIQPGDFLRIFKKLQDGILDLSHLDEGLADRGMHVFAELALGHGLQQRRLVTAFNRRQGHRLVAQRQQG